MFPFLSHFLSFLVCHLCFVLEENVFYICFFMCVAFCTLVGYVDTKNTLVLKLVVGASEKCTLKTYLRHLIKGTTNKHCTVSQMTIQRGTTQSIINFNLHPNNL